MRFPLYNSQSNNHSIFNDHSDSEYLSEDYTNLNTRTQKWDDPPSDLASDVECEIGRFNRSKEEYYLLERSFNRWVDSYRVSVYDSIREHMCLVYRRRRYILTAFKAFVIFSKGRWLRTALEEAEAYSLSVVIKRWKEYSVHNEYIRDNQPIAELFYRSSLAAKILRAFKEYTCFTKRKEELALRLVEVIKKSLKSSVLIPWYNYFKNEKRLNLCFKDIEINHKQTIKSLALCSICEVYNCRKGVTILSELLLIIEKRLVLHAFHRYSNSILEKEDAVKRGLDLLLLSKAFQHWRLLKNDKTTSYHFNHKLKDKAFHALNVELLSTDTSAFSFRKRYMDRKVTLSEKSALLHEKLSALRRENIWHLMERRVSAKNNADRVLNNLCVSIINAIMRRSIHSLLLNSMAVENDQRKELDALEYSKRSRFRRSILALEKYAETRRNKKDLYALADVNYRQYLLSITFQCLQNAHQQKIKELYDRVEAFVFNHTLLTLRTHFNFFKNGIQRSKQLHEIQSMFPLQNLLKCLYLPLLLSLPHEILGGGTGTLSEFPVTPISQREVKNFRDEESPLHSLLQALSTTMCY